MKINNKVEIEKSLRQALDLFQSSGNYPSVVALEFLANTLNCEWATYWIVDTTINRLLPAGIWLSAGANAGDLLQDTEHRSLAMSEGMAGHVWKSKKAFSTNHLEMHMCLPRSIYAHKVGFKSGIWFPIVANTTVYGVVELLSSKSQPTNSNLLDSLEIFGLRAGKLL